MFKSASILRTIPKSSTPSLIRPAVSARTMSTSISSDFGNKHITPGIGRVSNDLVIEKGKGTWVWTTDGKKWLDFTSGIVRHPHSALIGLAPILMWLMMCILFAYRYRESPASGTLTRPSPPP
jgi:hypothetical protein